MSLVQKFGYSTLPNGKAPVIPVEFWGRGRWHKLWAYVDSGASFTVLHTFEARRLGIKLSSCRKITMVVAGDSTIPVYLKKVRFRVGKVSLPVEVGFCSVLGRAFNLLGRKDIFKKFRISFNDRLEEISFHHS